MLLPGECKQEFGWTCQFAAAIQPYTKLLLRHSHHIIAAFSVKILVIFCAHWC